MIPNSGVQEWRGHRRVGFAVPLLIAGALLICILYVFFASSAKAQSSISVTTELEVLPVNVTDSSGTFVSGLKIENFRVLEDGRPQKITLFADEDNPVTLGLIVDHSRSIRPKLPRVAEAVRMIAHSSNPQDEMFVVDFSDNVSLEHPGGKDFTSDAKELEEAVTAVTASGRTALYDAMIQGLSHLQLGRNDKKALVIVSDGGDNTSSHKFKDVLDLARQSHAVIYAIGLVGESGEEENPAALRRLCQETGGIAFFLKAQESVADVSKKIARDLREQYTLGYEPDKKESPGNYHKVSVQVSVPGRGKMHVRTRAGYSAKLERELPAQQARGAP
jgi:Ca-activated chloride channel homolog